MSTRPGAFTYGPKTIDYEVQLLHSRKTLAIEVHPDGRVLVRAPAGCPEDIIAHRVQNRAAWILRQLKDFERFQPRTPPRHYVNGESHLYLGRQYRLKIVLAGSAEVRVERGHLSISLPAPASSERVREVLQRWYRDRARLHFEEALDAILPRFEGLGRPRLIVRTMQSRWGSLSSASNMTLNVNLVRAPRTCIEYVVAHELCHLRHRDHNDAFYQLLERVIPDWVKRKERLELALM
jgi:predicted metal-dependent hydrolase